MTIVFDIYYADYGGSDWVRGLASSSSAAAAAAPAVAAMKRPPPPGSAKSSWAWWYCWRGMPTLSNSKGL